MRTRSENTSKKYRWKWLIISLSTVAAVVVGLTVYWGVGVYSALDDFSKPPEESRFSGIAPDNTVEVPKWEGKERVNILLLGGDARDAKEGEVARSDSLLVASFDPVTKKAHLFSVLRDTYGPIEGHGRGRINTAITVGGPSLAMKTVGDLLGLEIQYYVYTDFEGFKSLIDTIGGIWFEVEKDMYYVDNADGNRYDINLKKGYQLLDGDKALQYVRFRHDALSDYTRTERQRNFLKAVAQELQSTWNLIRMKEILESVSPYIETNLTVGDMLKLGQLGIESHVGGSAQIPPMELVREETIGGASVISIRDEDALLGYVQEVLSKDETPSEQPAAPGGNVAAGSGNSSSAVSGSAVPRSNGASVGSSSASRDSSVSSSNDASASRGNSAGGGNSAGSGNAATGGNSASGGGSAGNGGFASGSNSAGGSNSTGSGSSTTGGNSASGGDSAGNGGSASGSNSAGGDNSGDSESSATGGGSAGGNNSGDSESSATDGNSASGDSSSDGNSAAGGEDGSLPVDSSVDEPGAESPNTSVSDSVYGDAETEG